MRLLVTILSIFIGTMMYTSCKVFVTDQPIKIYVSVNGNDTTSGTVTQPVRTLYRAQQLLRVARADHPSAPVTVFLRKGTYYLDSTLVFTPKDNPGGKASVIFQNYHHEKVIISGGRRLHLKWIPGKNGIYSAKLSAVSDFDQLFVNGTQQVRARYPNYDSSAAIFNGISREALSAERIRYWRHPEGGFIHALQKAHWGSLSYRITGRNINGRLQVEGGYQINRSHQIDSSAVFVENIREELDIVHEWYYDRTARELYYMPPEALDLQHTKIEVPLLNALIVFNGDTLHPVSRIHFEGIVFTHTTEAFMLTREPLLRGDWNIFRGGAVLLNGTEHCTFSNCNFESLGGNALFFSNYNRYDTVRHCLIRNAGASGICIVGNPSTVRSPSFNYSQTVPYNQLDKEVGPKNDDFPRDCYVYDNLIYNIGGIEKQTAGVELSMCMDISVIHNTIYHVPRSGININDGCWGGDVIEGNDVFETVLETGDHGAFNSWGRDRFWSSNRSYMDSLVAVHPELIKLDVMHPVIIRHNCFKCDHGWDIDLDDGSSNYIIDSNLCLHGGIKNREGFYRTVENNIMVNNTFHPHVWFKDSREKFMHNIVMSRYAPIGVSYWGDSVDYNLFPDSASLMQARSNGTDMHSLIGFPVFYDPPRGDFRIKITNSTRSIGFRNFSMNDFGVISPRLKTIAERPEFPVLFSRDNTEGDSIVFEWEGAEFKGVSGIGEQSALGLPKAEGIYITELSSNSAAYQNGLRKNDVILRVGGMNILSLSDFRQALMKDKNKKVINLEIFRDQKSHQLSFCMK